MKRRRARHLPALLAAFALGAALLATGCNRGGGERGPAHVPVNGSAQNAGTGATDAMPTLERAIDYARSARLAYLYVISRRDGGALTPEDITFIRQNMPPQVAYTVRTDDRRYVVLSSNVDLTPENKTALAGRFNFEDRSGS